MPALFTSTSTGPNFACVSHRCALRHVRLHREHIVGADPLRGFPRQFNIQFRQHHGRAFTYERAGNRRADAAPGAGDYRDLACEPVHFTWPRATANPLMNAFACEAVVATL
jgi:hypothetical protein